MKLQLLHRCSTRAVAGLVKGCSKIGRNILKLCTSCVASADCAVMSAAGDAAMEWEVLDPADDADLPLPADFAAAASCEFCAAPAEVVFLEIGLLGDSLQMLKTCCRHAASHLLLMQDLPAETLARRADAVMVLDADPGLPSCSMESSVQNARCQKCTVESGSAARLEATVQFPDGSTCVQRVCWDHAACLCLEMQNGSLKLKVVKRLL